ncbi:hypothetical protein FGIG_05276 [Fasciola gigantica]|uniref:Selenoprotein O n=1 Tax=Fasciola gigantica TaxID=46835 RepID=A0A504YA19_FASGI|nr:hypothetical protein FGIG_05276 [Fasciola gigantica]
MELTGADFTNTFVALGTAVADATDRCSHLCRINLNADHLMHGCCDVEELREAYQPSEMDRQRETLLRFAGVIRHVVERMDDRKVLKPVEKAQRLRLYENMSQDEKRARDRCLWQIWLDRYALRLRMDMDRRHEVSAEQRLELMYATNPQIVLRNYMAEQVIRAAESGDYLPAESLLETLRHPFKVNSHCFDQAQTEFTRPPNWARELRIT